MSRKSAWICTVFLVTVLYWGANAAWAVPSKCEECHRKITPGMVKDFNRGAMAATMNCADCHGSEHMTAADVANAELPTIETCGECHEDCQGKRPQVRAGGALPARNQLHHRGVRAPEAAGPGLAGVAAVGTVPGRPWEREK